MEKKGKGIDHGILMSEHNVYHHWLNMEFRCPKFICAPCVQLHSLAETPQLHPSPPIWAVIRERYWSARIDDISLLPPVHHERQKLLDQILICTVMALFFILVSSRLRWRNSLENMMSRIKWKCTVQSCSRIHRSCTELKPALKRGSRGVWMTLLYPRFKAGFNSRTGSVNSATGLYRTLSFILDSMFSKLRIPSAKTARYQDE
jgi:hypothetical protein